MGRFSQLVRGRVFALLRVRVVRRGMPALAVVRCPPCAHPRSKMFGWCFRQKARPPDEASPEDANPGERVARVQPRLTEAAQRSRRVAKSPRGFAKVRDPPRSWSPTGRPGLRLSKEAKHGLGDLVPVGPLPPFFFFFARVNEAGPPPRSPSADPHRALS